jgi:hypothetical protein
MTTGPATTPVTATPPRNAPARPTVSGAAWHAYLPAAVSAAYLAAWIAGLAAWPVNLPLNATAAQTTASYAAYPAEAATQYLLVEGLAGLLLGTVLACALLPRFRAPANRRVTATAAVLGAIAVATSVTQCVIGLILTSAAVGHDIITSGNLSNLVNQLDGVKMLTLAATAACLAIPAKPSPPLPRWLRVTALPLGLALAASGYAYLTLSNALAWTAYVSGLLLLLWVAGTGIALTARHRTPRPASTARA